MSKDPNWNFLNTKPNQIMVIDEKLKILRDGWVDARKDKRSGWMQKIDEAIDERLILMK